VAHRFTKQELLIVECMKDLIRIYYMEKARIEDIRQLHDLYLEKEAAVSEKIDLPGPTRSALAGLFKRLYGQDCVIEKRGKDLVFFKVTQLPNSSPRRPTWLISPYFWCKFVILLDELEKAVFRGEKKHFTSSERDDRFKTRIIRNYDTMELPGPDGPVLVTSDEYEEIARSDDPETAKTRYISRESVDVERFLPKSNALIARLTLAAIKEGSEKTHAVGRYHTLSIIPDPFLWVHEVTEFGSNVCCLQLDHDGQYDRFVSFSSFIGLRLGLDFLPVVQSLIMTFDLEMDGFERMKNCRQCEKIFFEKKKDAGRFCSPKCKTQFNRESEPRQKVLCRGRQNQWLGYQYNERKDLPTIVWKLYESHKHDDPKKLPEELPEVKKPDYVRKGDCTECNLCAPTGECSRLHYYNPKLVTAITESLKAIEQEKQNRIAKAKKR